MRQKDLLLKQDRHGNVYPFKQIGCDVCVRICPCRRATILKMRLTKQSAD